jgi:DNA-binding transcriptional ArsR family regulator
MPTLLSLPPLNPVRSREFLPADAHVAPMATLFADPARAAMLWALSDGRPLPAGDLARVARIGAPAASAHLAKLVEGGLLSAERHGRHRYFRLVEPGPVVAALESLAVISRPAPARGPKEAHASKAVRIARTCYDHLAGTLGVAIADAAVARGALLLQGREYVVTSTGTALFMSLGINVAAVAAAAAQTRRPLTRACLDWSERRYHIAGALGAALATQLVEQRWLERMPASRALRISNDGRRALWRHFGLRLYGEEEATHVR